MTVMWILFCLCLLAVAAMLLFYAWLGRKARRGESGTEIIAVAFAPVTLVVVLVAAPGGAWLAFDLATGAMPTPVRYGLRIIGAALAALQILNLLTAAGDSTKRDR